MLSLFCALSVMFCIFCLCLEPYIHCKIQLNILMISMLDMIGSILQYNARLVEIEVDMISMIL